MVVVWLWNAVPARSLAVVLPKQAQASIDPESDMPVRRRRRSSAQAARPALAGRCDGSGVSHVEQLIRQFVPCA
jgi:hypothetical protein